MANYANIKDTIKQNIKPNGNQQITGQVLQNVLNAIVDNLTAGYLLVGIATEDGNPGTPDQNLCWLATQGTYTNYGNITVESGKLAVIKYNGTWTSDTVDVQGAVTAGDGIAISGKGAVSVKTGTGVKIDEEGNVAADLVAGDYISIEGNKISCTLDANPFYFVDALPDSPVPGTENKVYAVSSSDNPVVNLYQWNAETSEFESVGAFNLGIDTSNFIKKGKNDITEPLELVAEEDMGLIGEMLVLRNKSGNFVCLKLTLGANATTLAVPEPSYTSPNAYLRLAKYASSGKLTLTIACGRAFIYINDSGTIEMSIPNTSKKMPIRPTFYIEAPAGESWDTPHSTFSIPGIYSTLKTVLALNADVVLTFPSRQVAISTDLQYFLEGHDIELTYRYAGLRFMLTVKSDNSITITPEAYIWRFNAKDYGIANWYNASGTNQTLYNDLRKLINGTNNVGGILGYLCDNSNVFVITNICFSDGTLEVGFHDAHSNVDRLLSINPSGQYNVLDVSTVRNTFSAIDIGVDTFYPTSNKSYSGLTDFATQFIRLAQSGMPVFLKTKNNQLSTSEDALVPIMNVIWSSGSVTAYYLKVESSRIGRFSISVTSKGNVTINTLGS